jgi:hypothetical protein
LVAVSLAPAIAVVASHDVHLDDSGNITTTADLPGWLAHPPAWPYAVTIGGFCLLFVTHQAISWRKAAGERRQQIKWLAAGGVATIGLGLAGSSLTSGLVQWILGLAIIGLPVGIGVGILIRRFRQRSASLWVFPSAILRWQEARPLLCAWEIWVIAAMWIA